VCVCVCVRVCEWVRVCASVCVGGGRECVSVCVCWGVGACLRDCEKVLLVSHHAPRPHLLGVHSLGLHPLLSLCKVSPFILLHGVVSPDSRAVPPHFAVPPLLALRRHSVLDSSQA